MKWIGIGIMAASVLLFGYLRDRMLRGRVENQERMLRLLQRLADQIGRYHLPLSEIYADFAAEEGRGGYGWGELLCREGLGGLLAQMGRGDLPQGSLQALRELSANLGTSGKNEQVAMVEQCLERMKQTCEAERADLSTRLRINRTVTVCGALMVVILFF